MTGDIRDEWRINDIEKKADEALRATHEISTLRSNVDSLECSNRELSTSVDELRHELQAFKDAIAQAFQY